MIGKSGSIVSLENEQDLQNWLASLSVGSSVELPAHDQRDISGKFSTYILRLSGSGNCKKLIPKILLAKSADARLLVVITSPLFATRSPNISAIHQELRQKTEDIQTQYFGNSFCFAVGCQMAVGPDFTTSLEQFYRDQLLHLSHKNHLLETKLAMQKRSQRRQIEHRQLEKNSELEIEAETQVLAASDATEQLLNSVEEGKAQIRDTLSFKLGYELIHGFKSASRFAQLPHSLWCLNSDAVRRKQAKKVKSTPKNSTATSSYTPSCSSRSSQLGDKQRKLQVACILDDFSFAAFSPECDLYALRPASWEETIKSRQFDILFVESAWRGKNGEWQDRVAPASVEFKNLLAFCKSKKIPTLFWSKEDPVHFSLFIDTAAHFDHVFTTDIDCIGRYKSILGHNRVYLLPFACQPKLHNPTKKRERQEGACFAGAYYSRFPERQRDFYRIVSTLKEFGSVEIFDRNYQPSGESRFPTYFHPLIKGKLEYSEIEKAYKGYQFAININSIKQSQSMFARRVFELLASNTLVVSNFSQGISILLGNLAIATDSTTTIEKWIHRLQDELTSRKYRLMGLRKVLSEHTYEHRFSYIRSKLLSSVDQVPEPKIAVVAMVESEAEFSQLYEMFVAQKYDNKHLYIIGNKSDCPTKAVSNYTLLDEGTELATPVTDFLVGHDFVAYFHPDDGYGPNYLLDMSLATKYTSCRCIGKNAMYCIDSGQSLQLHNDGSQYSNCESLDFRSSMVGTEYFSSWTMDGFKSRNSRIEGTCYSIDEFNYCLEGKLASGPQKLDYCGELDDIHTGLPILELLKLSESISPYKEPQNDTFLPDNLVRRFDTLTVVNYESMATSMLNLANTDLYCVSSRDFAFGEINGVQAMLGNSDDLRTVTESGYSQIRLHGVDERMWAAVVPRLAKANITVFFRDYSWDDIAPASWLREILSLQEEKLELQFPSKHLLTKMLELFSVERDSQNFQVAYPKLESCFSYTEKDQFYSNLVLVNIADAPPTVWQPLLESIRYLSESSVFSVFEIHVVCDKHNEADVIDALSKHQNVTIEAGDLTPSERAELYQHNGVLLSSDEACRDITLLREALASGLVPVVFDHGQASEFVGESMGELVSGTNPKAMAKTLESFASDPSPFLDRNQNIGNANNR